MPSPLEFDQEVASEICDRIARGQSLRKICGARRDDFIPGQTTVYRWLQENAEFAKQYARAREAQADHFVDEIIDIADSPNATTNPETGEIEVRDPQRDRLRIDARKWFAAKVAPKKYGDSVKVEGSLGVTVEIVRFADSAPEQLASPGLPTPALGLS